MCPSWESRMEIRDMMGEWRRGLVRKGAGTGLESDGREVLQRGEEGSPNLEAVWGMRGGELGSGRECRAGKGVGHIPSAVAERSRPA